MKNEDENEKNPLQPDFTVVDLAATVFLLMVLGSGVFWVYENFFAPDPASEQLKRDVEELQRKLAE